MTIRSWWPTAQATTYVVDFNTKYYATLSLTSNTVSDTRLAGLGSDSSTASGSPTQASRATAAERSADRTPEDQNCRVASRPDFDSPFKGCLDDFPLHCQTRFTRPSDGQLNSYVKFRWREAPYRRMRSPASSTSEISLNASTVNALLTPSQKLSGSPLTTASPKPGPTAYDNNNITRQCSTDSVEFARAAASSLSGHGPLGLHLPLEQLQRANPRPLPPHFGFMSKMDGMDRRLWSFCTFAVPNMPCLHGCIQIFSVTLTC